MAADTTTTRPSGTAAEEDRFHAEMRRLDLVALWERNLGRGEPHSEPAFHWRWRDIEPLIGLAVGATDMSEAERRVIQMRNPAFAPGTVCATTNINFGFQILMPGEKARPHRHNMNALRFVIEGEGAVTVVDGKSCPMAPGDMILTPGWTWHEHAHEGKDDRVVWLDSLDVPLVDQLGVAFFEPGPAPALPEIAPDSVFATAGFVPAEVAASSHSPLFRYPWGDAVAALAAMRPAADGSRTVRYVNPATGGAVMSLIDCYLVALDKAAETRPYRTTSNTACLVVEGEGVSRVGEETIRWQRNDVFTLPHWNWIAHRALSADAKLFQVTDREVLHRLGLLRDEAEP